MESPVDVRYRLLLLDRYLENAKEQHFYGSTKKWQFICPFCGSQGRTEGKRRQRKAALLWHQQQHSWVFSCAKKGSVRCMNAMTFAQFISALNPALGEAYKRDRWHSGTTGKGHNCRAPEALVGISTGLMDQSDPEPHPTDPPGGNASLCSVLVAVRCGRQRVGGAEFDSAASARTDPDTGFELPFPWWA